MFLYQLIGRRGCVGGLGFMLAVIVIGGIIGFIYQGLLSVCTSLGLC